MMVKNKTKQATEPKKRKRKKERWNERKKVFMVHSLVVCISLRLYNASI